MVSDTSNQNTEKDNLQKLFVNSLNNMDLKANNNNQGKNNLNSSTILKNNMTSIHISRENSPADKR